MARTLDLTDTRIQLVLRAVRNHPDCNTSELWFLELSKRGEGYTGKPGVFNFNYVERVLPKLREAGLIVRGTKFRMSLTAAGHAAIQPL